MQGLFCLISPVKLIVACPRFDLAGLKKLLKLQCDFMAQYIGSETRKAIK